MQVTTRDGVLYNINNDKLKILNYCMEATEKYNSSMVIIYDGRSGFGKTTMMLQDGHYCDRSPSGFGLHKVYFSPDDFLEGLANAEPNSFHAYDEAMIFSNRATMSVLNRTIVKAMSMIRSKRIIVAFCINSIFDLDRNLALSRADFLFHCYGKNVKQRGRFAAFFKSHRGKDKLKLLYLLGKKMYSYNKPKANFIGKFSKRFLVNNDEYEKKKQEGVNKSLKSTTKETRSNKYRWTENLIINLHEIEGWTQQKIADKAGVDQRTISNAINEGKKRLRGEEIP